MITIITGRDGSGKSNIIDGMIVKNMSDHNKVMLIVPEQQTVSTESRITSKAIEKGAPLYRLEVSSFSNLANLAFRTYGGVCYNYIGSGAKKIILWKALCSVKDSLKLYKNVSISDSSILSLLLGVIETMNSYDVSPESLLDAADQLFEENSESTLGAKISELSIIISAYKNILHEEFDDPSDDLPRLRDLLDTNKYFEGYNVYIDSFETLSKVQLDIVFRIMKQADNLYIALPIELDTYTRFGNVYTSIYDTYKKLCSEIKKAGLAKEERHVQSAVVEYKPNYHLSEIMWDTETEKPFTKEVPANIKIISCRNIFSQAEAVAIEIMKSIIEGGRFSDNLIITRDIKKYTGIIDAVFEKYDIPCFVSRRKELINKSISRLILSASNIICRDFMTEDIISYIKTGLSGITIDEADLLEEYVSLWQIRSREWTDGNDWEMNPDGYRDSFTSAQKDKLERINEVRQKVTIPLINLRESAAGEKTTRELAVAFYIFMEEIKVKESLKTREEGISEWNAVVNCFQELVNTAGDETILLSDFIKLLKLIIQESNYGIIPTSIDEVTIIDARHVFTGEYKNCYIIGAVEGEFPKKVSDSEYFNDSELVSLEGAGVVLSKTSGIKDGEERFYFMRAVGLAREKLTVFYYTKDINGEDLKPSEAVNEMLSFYPGITRTDFDNEPIYEKLYSKEAAFDYMLQLKGTELGDTLAEIFKDDPEYKARLASLDIPLDTLEESVSKESANNLFDRDLTLSNSRLEKFSKCKFAYYCSYVLYLSEPKTKDFQNVNIGDYTHRILEQFLSEYKKNPDMTKDEAAKIAERLIESYISMILPGKNRTNRMRELFRRLKRNTLFLIFSIMDELNQSEFKPAFFEMPIAANADVKPLKIELPSGHSVNIQGKIDRVDTLNKNGKLYIRIYDYKTGSKEFSVDDLSLGINMQIFLYLFSICSSKSELLRKEAGVKEDAEILPAGALYMQVTPKISASKLENDFSSDNIKEEAEKSLKRTGLLLNDMDILRAMEDNLSGKYIPFSIDAKNKIKGTNSLKSLEEFGSLLSGIKETISEISKQMKAGKADAVPLEKYTPCDWCSAKYICRRAEIKKHF